jgi:hypothetical protein
MKSYCENCGCAEYNGACVNCHEEIYIEDQYYENGDMPPDSILKKTKDQRVEAQRRLVAKSKDPK